ncbi:MAG: hypothetical protein PHX25_02830 [Candidatus Pacebacteria bacterium]|nr:hypothetical protein [Candidatus Paceibacterota bacterium]
MAKIISFESFKKQAEKDVSNTFEELLRKATLLKKMSANKALIKDFDGLKKAFEIQLNTFLLEKQLVGVDVFMCASYISSILCQFGSKIPESWYMTDYLVKDQENGGDGNALKEGADTCFILCSLYPERCNRRIMEKTDYILMGSSMYGAYYSKTGKEVIYHMAKRFELMSQVTAECVNKI